MGNALLKAEIEAANRKEEGKEEDEWIEDASAAVVPVDDGIKYQIETEFNALDRTTAEVAALDPEFFVESDLALAVTKYADGRGPGGKAYKQSLTFGARPWVRACPLISPPEPPLVRHR